MKVLVCSMGKPQTIKVVHWFEEHGFTDYTIVLSPSDDEAAYRRNPAVKGEIVKAPESVTSLTKKKSWMIKQFTKRGEWVLSIDDNVRYVTAIDPALENRSVIDDPKARMFNHKISPQRLIEVVEQDIERAKKLGAVHGGFASNSSALFRRKKYRSVGFVWGKVSYFQNVGLDWLEGIMEMDDYAYTAMCLLYSGAVLINNYYYANASRYERIGGTGTYEMRIPNKRKAAQAIMAAFPGLFRYADERPGFASGTEIKMTMSQPAQIAAWRKTMSGRAGKK